jgi:hypothetical protein
MWTPVASRPERWYFFASFERCDMIKKKMRSLAAAALLAGLPAAAAAQVLFSDPFSQYPNGVVTSEYQHASGTCPCSTLWDMTSGTLYAASGHGWTGAPDATNHSAIFRMTTFKDDIGDAAVTFRLYNKGFVTTSRTPAQVYDGVHVWLRYQSAFGPLYALTVNRRDGAVVIKKKVPGGPSPSDGGTYYTLATGSFAVPISIWQSVKASAKNNPDGSVTLELYANGKLLARAVDNGSVGGAPFRAAGRIGLRGDNDNFMFDAFLASSLSPATAPVISGVSASGVTQTAAAVAWTTDKPSRSQVEYGVTTSYGALTPQSGTSSTAHGVALSGLQAGTLYHYRAKSLDDATGLVAVSNDHTFSTLAAATAPLATSVQSAGLTQTGATIYWSTDKVSHSQVQYGPTTAYGGLTGRSTAAGTSHSMPLSSLQPGTVYHYRVLSLDDATGLTGVSGDYVFTTQAAAPAAPPVVSAVSASGLTQTTANIAWLTDKISHSQVEHGLSAAYGASTPASAATGLSHAVALSGLRPGTLYHYRVRSLDDATGLTGISGDSTFTTPGLTNVITSVQATGVNNAQATIAWTTTLISHSQVQYGLTAAYGSTSPRSTATGVYHSMPLSSLKHGTVYHYRVLSLDQYGNTAVSGDYTFKTAGPGA